MSTVTVTYFSTTLMIIDRSMRQNVSEDTLLFRPVCLCKPMDCSPPGFPVLHCLLALLQTQVRWVDVASQPSQPLLPASPAPNLSQYHSFLMSQWFASGGRLLELQHQSFQWIFRVDFFYDGLVWSLLSKDSWEVSPASKFKSINSSALRLLYGPALTSIRD